MSNMSYCRFQNTYGDLLECLDALKYPQGLSGDECRAAMRMFQSFLCFCRDEEIIEDFDEQRIEEILDELHTRRD
jgi:hypothetical protein